MKTPNNKPTQNTDRRVLPFFIDFVKFACGFAAIIALALLSLHFASAAI
jgi:hypothetical protein